MLAPSQCANIAQPFTQHAVNEVGVGQDGAMSSNDQREDVLVALDEERDSLLSHIDQCHAQIKQAFDQCHQTLALRFQESSKGCNGTDAIESLTPRFPMPTQPARGESVSWTPSNSIGICSEGSLGVKSWKKVASIDTGVSHASSVLKPPARRTSVKSPAGSGMGPERSVKSTGSRSGVVFTEDGENVDRTECISNASGIGSNHSGTNRRESNRRKSRKMDELENDPAFKLKKNITSEHVDRQFGYQSRVDKYTPVHTPMLDLFIVFVIVANGLAIAINVQWQGFLTAVELGIQVDDGGWNHASIVFDILEHVFTAIFIMEMIIRLVVQGWRYYKSPANAFDGFLVASAVLDVYILSMITNSSDNAGQNLTLLRFARMFKFARVLRAVRIFSFCSALRVLIKSIGTGFFNLIWSMILLGGIMAVVGLMMCQLIRPTILSESTPYDSRLWLYKNYGTAARAMYTMFQVTLSGCWPQYAERLIQEVSAWFAVVFILYVLIVVFAVIRVISALFLRDTLQNAKKDADMMIAEQMKLKEAYINKLRLAFQSIESSGTGWVTRADFDVVMQNPKELAYLAVLDLEVNESSQLFRLLDNQSEGRITLEDFLDGVIRLKGQARALDVISIQQDFKTLYRGFRYMNDNFERVYGTLPDSRPSKIIFKKLSCRSKSDSEDDLWMVRDQMALHGSMTGSNSCDLNDLILGRSPV